MELTFTVYGKPEPQGSIRAFVPKGWTRPVLTSTNKKLKGWRNAVAMTAREQIYEGAVMNGARWVIADAGVPVGVEFTFFLLKPRSAKKNRSCPAVKPDLDKLMRAACDAMTGIVYLDDAQVCEATVRKCYGTPERTEIRVWLLAAGSQFVTPLQKVA